MILPLRVFGRLSPKRMSFGLAIGPISLATQSRSSLAIFFASSPVGRGRFRTTKAQIASPVVSSGRPTTAASATSAVFDDQRRLDLHRPHAVAADVEDVVDPAR